MDEGLKVIIFIISAGIFGYWLNKRFKDNNPDKVNWDGELDDESQDQVIKIFWVVVIIAMFYFGLIK